jgi:dTDP-4-dehydrorhamnose reductase
VAARRPQFDFDRLDTLNFCLAEVRPRAVINAAAYTAVDAAEQNMAAAVRANHTGPARLAALCAGMGIPLIHISTDYVFDGCKAAPYTERDRTNPLGVYGATKQAGESAILATGANAIILRTSWLYAAQGKNFARTMLHAARKTGRLNVVSDQKGAPTSAPDLAAAILYLISILDAGWEKKYRGIFHASSSGETSWHGFASAIFAAAAPRGFKAPAISAIATSEWPTPATRPADSRLDCSKLKEIFGCALPPWQRSLPAIVAEILERDGVGERLH